MEWQSPRFLYLILPLCIGWLVLALYSERRRQRARESFVAQPMWSRVLPATSQARFWLKLVLRQAAIVAGLMSLAGPQFGTQFEQVVARGSDLYVVVDVSRSMLADDVPPSRLERAKADVSALVNRLEGERVGLIAFAGQAVVKCPLTVDYDSFRRALNELDPNSAPRGGTAIGDAIRKAIEVFDSKSQRDQAVLIITDGDDQESYPLEAATIAAERKVTLFTVGLGDNDKGSRVPQKDAGSFVEYEGQQVWSKLNGYLLQEIAMKTSGVYIPAGTRAYDLGELYSAHLQGRNGDGSETEQRVRKSERFQIFLAIALLALLTDLCISPYMVSDSRVTSASGPEMRRSQARTMPRSGSVALCIFIATGNPLSAGEEVSRIRDGIKLYKQEKYDEAGKEFAAAGEQLSKLKSEQAAVASFDEACAYHRNGELEKARDRYLKAGLSQDRKLATSSHFNLGTMSAENARKLAGERPEEVPTEKRQQILDELKQAIASYRHCLEIQTDHTPSRRNLELVRNWINFYTDRWRELDRQKLRNESNLITFLEFLMKSETAIEESVKQFPEHVATNAFAEIKRTQDELREEIPTLRKKIATELLPAESQAGSKQQPVARELQDGIKRLQSWADEADNKMANASSQLAKADAKEAVSFQQAALDELDRIWDAVIPFQPLLAKELSDQTTIAKTLGMDFPKDAPGTDGTGPAAAKPLLFSNEEVNALSKAQEKSLRKAKLLAPKAEAELDRVESERQPQADVPSSATTSPSPPPADPELVKAGLRKAIELGPKAVEAMEATVQTLKAKNFASAVEHAEEARRILEEMQQAQPKSEQENKDQEKKEQEENKDQSKDNEQNKDDEQPSQDEKKPEQKKPEQKKPDDQKDGSKDEMLNQEKQSAPKRIAQDRIEEALRKVREREQEKRERDREFRMRIIGQAPVDKDW